MMRRRTILVSGLGLAALLIGTSAAIVPQLVENDPPAAAANIGGPFTLIDGDGRTVTDASFRGKWMLVYFGYTHCPDACPTALSNVALTLQSLGSKSAAIQPIFITVDPDRDTPAVMKSYVSAFGASIVGLSGNQAAITHAEQEYCVYAAKHPAKNGDYDMDHSSIIYVMDQQGRFVQLFTHETTPEAMAAKLEQLGA